MSGLTLDSVLESIKTPKSAGIEKVASEESVADQLKKTLTKEASEASNTGDVNMSKTVGQELASKIMAGLEKAAEAGTVSASAPTTNQVIKDTDEQDRQQAATVEPNPTKGKTVTETAEAIMARGGGEQCDSVDGAKEGNADAPEGAVKSDIEKVAAVTELMEKGASFEEAVAALSEAEDEINLELEKVAATATLLEKGLDFEDAVALVKQASEEMYPTEEYSAMEKFAAVTELMDDSEDPMSFDEASYYVTQVTK